MSATRPVVRNVRLTVETDAQVQALAEVETEGNVSLMLRKLLSEALEARAAHMAAAPTPQLANWASEELLRAGVELRALQPRGNPTQVEPAPPPVKPARKPPRATEPREAAAADKPMSKVEAQKAQREARYR